MCMAWICSRRVSSSRIVTVGPELGNDGALTGEMRPNLLDVPLGKLEMLFPELAVHHY
jgi:hypothetical protein